MSLRRAFRPFLHPTPPPSPASAGAAASSAPHPYQAFDLLATLVAVVRPDGTCEFANTAVETLFNLPRRAVQGSNLLEWFIDTGRLIEALEGVSRNAFSSSRFDAVIRRGPRTHEIGRAHV